MRDETYMPAIIVMVKAPRPGAVKTRLMPLLSAEEAASLDACFVQDTVDNMRALNTRILIAYTPTDAREFLEPLLPSNLLWVEQRGADLGERMANTIAIAASQGYGPLVVVGTDSPHLPNDPIETAIRALMTDSADVTLGPTDDGGYYLVGLRRPTPQLLENVAWSTSRAYADTAANACRLRLRLLRLPVGYDIDTPADLIRLSDQARATPTLKAHIPRTARWIGSRDTKASHEKPT